jgi:hypothetical protein
MLLENVVRPTIQMAQGNNTKTAWSVPSGQMFGDRDSAFRGVRLALTDAGIWTLRVRLPKAAAAHGEMEEKRKEELQRR